MIAKGSGYIRGNRDAARARLVSHMKYIEHRSRELSRESRDDRRIFDKHSDVVNRHDAVSDVMEPYQYQRELSQDCTVEEPTAYQSG